VNPQNLDICLYHCLILTLILHLKVLFNFFFLLLLLFFLLLLVFIIYIVNLPVVRSRSCRIIYYFDTPALGRRHQSFGRVTRQPDPASFCSVLSQTQNYWVLLDSRTQCYYHFLKMLWVWLSNQTQHPAAMPDPTVFGRESNTPSCNF